MPGESRAISLSVLICMRLFGGCGSDVNHELRLMDGNLIAGRVIGTKITKTLGKGKAAKEKKKRT